MSVRFIVSGIFIVIALFRGAGFLGVGSFAFMRVGAFSFCGFCGAGGCFGLVRVGLAWFPANLFESMFRNDLISRVLHYLVSHNHFISFCFVKFCLFMM